MRRSLMRAGLQKLLGALGVVLALPRPTLVDPRRRPRVAIIGTRGYPSYYGGFETAVRKLAPYLADVGWDVTVYGRHSNVRADDPAIHQRVRSVITRGIDNKSLSTLTYGFTATLHSLFHKPDVALVMNVANGYWLPLLKLRGVPTVVNVDGIEWERDKWGKLAKAIFYWGATLTAWFGDELVFDAKAIERHWTSAFGRSGTFIPYGGDIVEPLPVEPGLESGRYVLLVARFVPENTVVEFFDAAEKLAGFGIQVVLVGSTGNLGELDDRARALAAKHDSIDWKGHVSDDRKLFALWQHAGVYFHGHSVGGTNPALVQAMALGTPVLARDTDFNREVLGDAGRFVEPDAHLIATAIHACLSDADWRSRASATGRARVADQYMWQFVCERYEGLMRCAVPSNRNAVASERRMADSSSGGDT